MSFARIVVTTDFSEPANEALAVASDLAAKFDAELTLLHIAEPALHVADHIFPVRAVREGKEKKLGTKKLLELIEKSELGDDVQVALKVHTSPVEGILSFLAEATPDLLVISTAGRTGLERLLIGSVTERVVRHAPCAVLTVKSGAKKP